MIEIQYKHSTLCVTEVSEVSVCSCFAIILACVAIYMVMFIDNINVVFNTPAISLQQQRFYCVHKPFWYVIRSTHQFYIIL